MSIWSTADLDFSKMNEDFRHLAGVPDAVAHQKAVTEAQIAQTILKQLGGTGKLSAMIGANNFVDHGKAVSFKWPARQQSKGNYVIITLRGDDTYDVEFSTVGKFGDKKVRKKYTGIYADQLIPTFTGQTGYALRL